ncbi:dephospho-CoA kinase [Tenacibaculum larymnensis]|uniref:Dephospho-CoA kinase n=1 Tax=Tenacibaculum larymnensis TaxID=2878201 RepID=A0A9X4EWX9_9FLAO|nr:dephospho-CoA kinase [Tenacibaculum larymnensis]MDE1208222.1 dephospho-CoA kinase [Tenacibaculum larymnensis]
MVVGLTGGIGSGKSTIVKMFSEFENIAIYIADDEAKKLMVTSPKIKNQLIAEFGKQVYINNELNRPYLASIVFNNKKKLTILNNIVHPVVNEHLQNFIKKNSNKEYILYENAILFENESDSFCDKIITVTAPENIRIDRVMKRDNSTIKDVKNRIKNQWSETKKALQSNYLIENLTLTNSKEQVLKIHNSLTKKMR